MAMPNTSNCPPSVTLPLSPAEQWTLHHVLLDRINQELTVVEPSRVDPPPIEVFQAFETVDAGETIFTIPQLEALQPILAEYHRSPTWEFDRARLEQLLHYVAEPLE